MTLKKIYYYIDEAGSLESDSNFFILGCYKTDTPENIRQKINSLKEELVNSPYFAFERKKFIKQGFHACENHFDIRARFYNLISTLNVRAYILLLNKRTKYFDFLIKMNDADGVYNMCIQKLVRSRLIKARNDRNTLIFEQYGSQLSRWQKKVDAAVKDIYSQVNSSFGTELRYNVEVHSKADVNLSIIDYVNFLFVQFYEHRRFEQRMIENFKIIEPKIGLIYKMDKDIFFNSKDRIDIRTY